MNSITSKTLSRSPDSVVSDFPPQPKNNSSRTTCDYYSLLMRSVLFTSGGDILSHILLFLNYNEACQASQVFVPEAAAASSSGHKLAAVWREILARRGFSAQGSNIQQQDLRQEYAKRLQWLNQLCHDGTGSPHSSCSLTLPTKSRAYFVQRSGLCCDSDFLRRHRQRGRPKKALFEFQLTSTSTGSELMVLDRNNRGVTTVSLVQNIQPLAMESDFLELFAQCTDHEEKFRSILFQTEHEDISQARLLPTVYSPNERTAMYGLVLGEAGGNTEFRLWSKVNGSKATMHFTCRVPFRVSSLVDSSVGKQRVFVVVQGDDDEADGATPVISSLVQVYRILPSDDSNQGFTPIYSLDCKEPILSLKACPAGDRLLVATTRNLQVYDLSRDLYPQLLESISFHSVGEKAFEGLRNDSFVKALFGDRTDDDLAPALSQVSIHAPRHLPLETAGFVTLQTQSYHTVSRTFGNHTIYLWEMRQGSWGVCSMINLPLLLRTAPQIHYDGNRLIVFGRDHIGLIVLVYEIRITLEAIMASPTSFKDGLGGKETSGGVYNFASHGTSPVRYANRIRHVALGLEPTEELQMTCNERFIMLRTKSGTRLEGSNDDGLLVIDLLED